MAQSSLGYVDDSATVTLTNAQVLTLRATPVTIVAAPLATKAIVFKSAAITVDGTAGAFTESTANLGFKMVDGSGVQVATTVETTGFIDQAGIMHTRANPKLDPIMTAAQVAGKALVLHNLGAGEYAGGNVANSMKVTVYYDLVDIV